ncbi:Putative aminoacrylate hydrolase RutD [Streptomyces tendae]
MSRLLHVADGPYAPPAPARELTVTAADGARIHVEVHGPENAPAVVLAHGWCCSTAFWAAQIRELAADHRVIAYDQRGHGRSPGQLRRRAAAEAKGAPGCCGWAPLPCHPRLRGGLLPRRQRRTGPVRYGVITGRRGRRVGLQQLQRQPHRLVEHRVAALGPVQG